MRNFVMEVWLNLNFVAIRGVKDHWYITSDTLQNIIVANAIYLDHKLLYI